MDPPRRPATTVPEPAAVIPLLLLTGVWAWWAWKIGAYLGSIAVPITGVVFPGTMILCAGTVLLAWTAPMRARLSASPPVRAAAFALVGLAFWYLLSALWSPAPDAAIIDAQRVFAYVMAFGFGICLCNLLAPRMLLSLVPIAVAGGGVALATAIVLSTGHDVSRYLEIDGTLQYPLGYRNANGAFFGIAFWVLVGAASIRTFAWWARALASGGAALSLSLVLLSQSRGSQLAGAVSVVVFLCIFPRRTNSLIWLLVSALPALLVVPHLGDLFEETDVRPGVSTVHSAGVATLEAGLLALLLGAALALVARRTVVAPETERKADRTVAQALVAAAVIGLIAFVVAVGNPVSWIGDKADQLNSGFASTTTGQSTRFGLNFGTHRGGIWRIALGDAGRNPLLGDGGGGFQYSFLKHRDPTQVPVHDAHGIGFETLAELGFPGLLLVLTFLGGVVLGIRRSRRLGPAASALGAIALVAGSYWLAQTSIDWFWPYPAVTAPAIALLGSACAPALRTLDVVSLGRWRVAVSVAAVAVGISTLAPWFAEQWVNHAYGEWRTDFPKAMSDLDRAKSVFPVSSGPMLVKGFIANQAGRRAIAIDAFKDVTEQQPEEWASHYYLALYYRKSDPALARQQLAEALAQNPYEPVLLALKKSLG
jgi:O-Antigen ligase